MITRFEINYSDAPIPNEINTDADFKVGDGFYHLNYEVNVKSRVKEVQWVLDETSNEFYRVVVLEEKEAKK